MFRIKQAKRLSIEKSSRHVTNLKILLAWCEVCSAIRDGKECQRANWKKHKLVCASSANKAILTEEKAAFAREGQKKKKAKAKANKKVAGKNK